MNYKFEILKLNNENIISTSGNTCSHSTSDHVRILSGNGESCSCIKYEYSNNFAIPAEGSGPKDIPTSKFINPDLESGHQYKWYYYDGTNYRLCTDNHDYIDTELDNHNTNYLVGPM